MPISFLNDPTLSDLISSRPIGYKFPTGISQLANGPTSVDYLVVAGGGGGYISGGGAGGFRTATGFGITNGTTYAVTVGGGGTPGSQGSSSIFSSIRNFLKRLCSFKTSSVNSFFRK